MLNNITLLGRLTATPELKSTSSGVSVTAFTIAVERNFTDKASGERPTDFINIVAWRGTAEFVSRYFVKGEFIAVQGSLQSRKWEDKNGNNRVSWEVIADHVFFAESKRDGNQNAANIPANVSETEFAPLPDDDLPF